MAAEKNTVFVELYDLTITDRDDDRFGRVVTGASLSEDDLINIAVKRRTDLNPATLRASMDILKEVAVEEIANGASVQYGLGYFSLDVKGVFYGDHPVWDPAQHSLRVRTTASSELRQALRNITVKMRGMANVGTYINSVTDVASGEDNTKLTAGGGVNITGERIKITGENSEVGLYLVNQASGVAVKVPTNAILTNEPKKVSFVVPAAITHGDYKIKIATQFSGNTGSPLKEPRTYLFDVVFIVE
jgi:hypothetical protein